MMPGGQAAPEPLIREVLESGRLPGTPMGSAAHGPFGLGACVSSWDTPVGPAWEPLSGQCISPVPWTN